MINIGSYLDEDVEETWLLFFKTIHTINIRDYTSDQVSAWAPDNFDMSVWKSRMSSINPFIAETDGVIAGYSDLQSSGLIDHFFCHHNYQGCGVGKALMSQIFE
jgi:putative acetyltransferase